MSEFSTVNFDEVLGIVNQLDVRSQQAWVKAAMLSLCMKKRCGYCSTVSPAVEAVREIGHYLSDPASMISWAGDKQAAYKDLDDATTECKMAVQLIKKNDLKCTDFELTLNEFLAFMEVCESDLFQQLKTYISPSTGGNEESNKFAYDPVSAGSGVMAFLAAAAGYKNAAFDDVIGNTDEESAGVDDTDYIQSITYSSGDGYLSFMSRGRAIDLSIGNNFSLESLLSKLKNDLPIHECSKSMNEVYNEIRTGCSGMDRDDENSEWRERYNYYYYEYEFSMVVDDGLLKIMAKRYNGSDGEFVLVYVCKVLTWKCNEEELLVYKMPEIDCMIEGSSGVSY